MPILAIYSSDSVIKHKAINELKRHGFVTYDMIYPNPDDSQIRRDLYAMCADNENVIIEPEHVNVASRRQVIYIRLVNRTNPDFSNYLYGDSSNFELKNILYSDENEAIKKIFEYLEIKYLRRSCFENEWVKTGSVIGILSIIGYLLQAAYYP